MNSLKANQQTKIENETNLEPESQSNGAKENETMITAAMMNDDHDNNANNEEPNTNETDGDISTPSDEQTKDDVNPFDPDRLKLGQDFLSSMGVKKHQLTIPVRKPDKQAFIRVHPDDSYSQSFAVIDLKEDGDQYIVSPEIRSEVSEEITPKRIYTAITRQGTLFLWPIRLPGIDGKLDDWNQSALEAAELAKNKWLRVTSNMDLRAYESFEPLGSIPEPEWPDKTFLEILQIAFKGKLIETLDHPVIKRLRGEV